MKELFHNHSGYNTACIKVKTQGQILELFYHLNDNPVQHQWQKLQSSAENYVTHPLYKVPLYKVTDLLIDLAKQKGYTVTKPLDQAQLNYLHGEFVKFQGTDQVWADINTYIHIAEDKLDPFTDFNSVIFFTADPEPAHVPLEEKYKLWLTTEQSWGDLQLGYASIGKAWEDIAKDNDGTDDLTIKSTISTETRMHFHVEPPWKKFAEKQFYDWAKTRDDVPLDNLNALGLGKYFLGNIIITDTFLKFHNNASDWYVPNHACKLRWNKHVIGPDAKIVAVEFFESDMYYNSLMEHTEFNNA
jgi:hypothetical protein